MTALQKKTVNKIIKYRVHSWVKSLNSEDALAQVLPPVEGETEEARKSRYDKWRTEVFNSVIVTGGCFTSMLHGEEVNDFDIYFNSKDVAEQVANYYVATLKDEGSLKTTDLVPEICVSQTADGVDIMIRSQGVSGVDIDTDDYAYFECYGPGAMEQFFEKYHKKMASKVERDKIKGYVPLFVTSNAMTLSNKIQIILRFCGTPDEIHANFDFVHATNYWTNEEGVVYRQDALVATMERRLRYVGSRYPVSTIFRLRKFLQRGWKISAGEIVKIAFDTSNLDLTDINTLRDQTMGMDSAYFSQVISMISQRDSSLELDRTYLISCIDKVFNEDGNTDDEGQYIVDEDTESSELEL